MTDTRSLTAPREFVAPAPGDPALPFRVDPERYEAFRLVRQLRAEDPDISRDTAERLCYDPNVDVVDALVRNPAVPEDVRVVARLRLDGDGSFGSSDPLWDTDTAMWDDDVLGAVVTDLIAPGSGVLTRPPGVEVDLTVIIIGNGHEESSLLFCLEPPLNSVDPFLRISRLMVDVSDLIPRELAPETLWGMACAIADEYNELWPAWCKLHDIPNG